MNTDTEFGPENIQRASAPKRRAARMNANIPGPTESEGGIELAPALCWQAFYSRDSRFDGRFFVGVITTGIYCRPICPVPFAKSANIVWFASAAAAEADGFRPCQRCRPQASPGTPAWLGTSAVVSRALRLIWVGALDEGTVDALAERVGIGSRQLRRLFVQHLGAPPIKIAGTRRIHFARKLIDETELPITEIAFSAGFKSLREFNHAMKSACGQSPRQLRRLRGEFQRVPGRAGLLIRLPYRPPFNWSALIRYLRQRATPCVEMVRDEFYRRTIEIGDAAGTIDVRPEKDEPCLLVRIDLPKYECLMQVVERVRRIFDLTADPVQIAEHLARDSRLKPHLDALPGLRVPGAWDGFELAVRAILGHQLTGTDSSGITGRLVQTFGRPMNTSFRGPYALVSTPRSASQRRSFGGGYRRSIQRVNSISRAVRLPKRAHL